MGSESKFLRLTKKVRASKQGQRRSLSAGDLTDAELEAIARAEIPPAERYRLKNVRPTRKRRSVRR